MRLCTFAWISLSAGLSIASMPACKSSASGPSPSGSAGPQASPLPGAAFFEGFEGEIDAQATRARSGDPGPTAIAALLKSGKFRFDLPEKMTDSEQAQRMFGPKPYAIFDSSTKKLSVVSDAKKQVVVIDLNHAGERFKNMGGAPPPSGKAEPPKPETKLQKTGKHETVVGRSCEDWDIVTDHRQGTVCVAQEGISWLSLPAAALPPERAWALEMMDGKHFPMKYVGYGDDGVTEESRLEITKLEKKAVSDSMFQPPEDYRVMDLDQLVQSFAGMHRGLAGAMAADNGGTGAAMPGGNAPAAARPATAMPAGMPSNLPGLTPEQMRLIQQRLQQAQQRQP